MKKLLASAVVAGLGAATSVLACPCDRLLATWPPEARTQVRAGDESGTNGRLWRSRPLVNGGPAPYYSGNPGAEAYGAWGEEDLKVYVKVGQTVVVISPWEQYTLDGMQTFEHARQQWLRENGYTGGVRTFRRTDPAADAVIEVAAADPQVPEPRATIQIPEGARRKRGFQVDSGRQHEAALRLAALKAGDQPVRISWPMNAPAEARALSDASGGYLLPGAQTELAHREP
jgi:hypothetical protein